MRNVIGAAVALLLAFGALGAQPANGAEAGFHAAYFSESSFLTLSPGQTGQFSVGFTNTGTEAWTRGVSGKQASLHTAAPLDNPLDHTAGWSVNWSAPNVYAIQANDLVAPGQVGFFTYTITVPAGTAFATTKTFYGRPAVDGVGFMEDYGYYQSVTVAGSVVITAVTPASPSTTNRPTLSGTGAAANETVSITDGSSGPTVGTAVADASGNWTATISTGLTAGTHILYASTLTKGLSAGAQYTVTGTTGPIVTEAYATSLTSVTVTFSSAMTCTSTSGRNDMTNQLNYFVNVLPAGTLGPTVSTATASTDCTTATLTLSSSLTVGTNYQVVVYFAASQSGTVVDAQHNTAQFRVGAPQITAVTTKQDGTATITFDRSMSTSGGTTGAYSVLNPNNYSVDNITAASTTSIACVTAGTNGCVTVQLTFTGGTSSVLGVSGQVRTIRVTNVTDAVSGGRTITPNPSARQVATGA